MAVLSPDYTAYIDLTLDDVQPFELDQRALTQLALNLPGWNQLVANTEVALIEALDLSVAELVYAINRLPSATVTAILKLKGFVPDVGAPATATATFTVTDTLGHTIPAGTRVRLALGTAVLPTLDFVTGADLIIAPGAAVGTTAIEAVLNTDAPNNTASGTVLSYVTGASFIVSIVLATNISGGRLPEDGAGFIARAIQGFQRSEALVTPDQFTAAALTNVAVYRARTISNWDGSGTPGDQPGFTTTAVYGIGDAAVPGPNKTAILAMLQAAALVNLTVAVVDPEITVVNVDVTVVRTPTAASSDVHDAVTAAVEAYLSTDTWPWGGTVKVNELVAVIDRTPGVDLVQTVTLPASDVALTGPAPLARLGTLTVTVVDP